jgi:Tricorn protease C1 domain
MRTFRQASREFADRGRWPSDNVIVPTTRQRIAAASFQGEFTLNELIHMAQSRRCFLQLMAIAVASAGTPNLLYAQQGGSHEPVTLDAACSGVTTFEDVWRTVRDRFYDRHLNGLDWSAVRDRFMPAAACALGCQVMFSLATNLSASTCASCLVAKDHRDRSLIFLSSKTLQRQRLGLSTSAAMIDVRA